MTCLIFLINVNFIKNLLGEEFSLYYKSREIIKLNLRDLSIYDILNKRYLTLQKIKFYDFVTQFHSACLVGQNKHWTYHITFMKLHDNLGNLNQVEVKVKKYKRRWFRAKKLYSVSNLHFRKSVNKTRRSAS